MQNFNRYVQVRLNNKLFEKLKLKANKVGLSKSNFIRVLIDDKKINEKPDENFYIYLSKISEATDKINKIINNRYMDNYYLKQKIEQLDKLILDLKQKYL